MNARFPMQPDALRVDTEVLGEARCHAPLFESVFLGGFECSCHVLENGRRLDLLRTTRHAAIAELDYARLRATGIRGCRDGVSWVCSERRGGYDFSQAESMLRAAERTGVQVAWDLMHFGWPDDVDVFAPSFPGRFARYARAFARWYAGSTDHTPMIAPINEISFLAWAGGDVRCMNPFEAARGVELKVQLVLATIAAIEAIRDVIPGARFLQPDPIVYIHASPERPKTWRKVESDNLLRYQTWDMLEGRIWPRLGGHPRYLDVLGVNYYPANQFTPDGDTVEPSDPRYVPFRTLLLEVAARYRRPMIVSETGAEGDARAPWLRYVGRECAAAMREGCELHAITLYPIVNHPGWVDDRHCENGLWDYADEQGGREVHEPLAREIAIQTPILTAARDAMLAPATGD